MNDIDKVEIIYHAIERYHENLTAELRKYLNDFINSDESKSHDVSKIIESCELQIETMDHYHKGLITCIEASIDRYNRMNNISVSHTDQSEEDNHE